ncbi:DPP IV N-terminal domain-containing protein [Chryseobacterium wanjuense]
MFPKNELSSENYEQQQFSPDQQNNIFFKDNNIWLSNKNSKEIFQLTTDGIKDYAWNIPNSAWSPDDRKIFLRKLDDRKVSSIFRLLITQNR